MGELKDEEFPVLDRGFIRVVDTMGDDASPVQTARVSYGPGTRTLRDDTKLLRFLLREKHTSPFESAVIKVHVKCPIFVARQWMRHRTWSYNEVSARYSEMLDEFYIPSSFRSQDTKNRQGSGDALVGKGRQSRLVEVFKSSCEDSYLTYQHLLKAGVSREQARAVLPTALYTQFYGTVDCHNLMKFIQLRIDPHAQYEIRAYADTLLSILHIWMPETAKAFEEYVIPKTEE